jgi:hypothetical protein
VFGGEHDIANSRNTSQSSPFVGIKAGGIEGFGEFGEEAVCVVGGRSYQRMTDDNAELAVHAPMNEETESLVAKPLNAVGFVA